MSAFGNGLNKYRNGTKRWKRGERRKTIPVFRKLFSEYFEDTQVQQSRVLRQ